MDEYGWNNGVADYPTLFSGVDMVYYEDRIRDAIDQRNSADGGNLMLYFDERRNHEVKAKILSPSRRWKYETENSRDALRFGWKRLSLKQKWKICRIT